MNRTDWEEIRNQTCMQISYPGWNCRRPWHSFWNLNIGRTFIPVPEPPVEEMENLVRWMLVVASALSDWAVGWIWDWSPPQNRCTLHHRCRCRSPSRTRGRGRDGQGSEGIIRWEFSAEHVAVQHAANHRSLVGVQTKPLASIDVWGGLAPNPHDLPAST